MKKLFAFILAFACLFLASCGAADNPVNTTTSGVTSTTEKTNPTEPDKEPYYVKGYQAGGIPFVGAKSRVLLSLDSDIINYYSKVDGKCYVMCFDPLCEHDSESGCPAWCFESSISGRLNLGCSIEYCEYNNRFYVSRGQQLYSFSFDGSDIKLECSFGEEGKDLQSFSGAGADVTYMRVYGSYVYMLFRDYENDTDQNRDMMRYNIKNGKTENLTEINGLEEYDIQSFMIAGDKLIITAESEEGYGYYSADMDMENMHTFLDSDRTLNIDKSVYDGKYLYASAMPGIVRIDLDTGEEKILLEDNITKNYTSGKKSYSLTYTPRIYAVSNGYVYYNVSDEKDKIFMGYNGNQSGLNEVYNSSFKIYRLNINTLNIDIVYRNDGEKIQNIFFVDNSKVIINSDEFYTKTDYYGKLGVFSRTKTCIADIEENGYFINLKELVCEDY